MSRRTSSRPIPARVRLTVESCDCGGGYPCIHGAYVYGIESAAFDERRWSLTEVAEFPDWMLARIALSDRLVALAADVMHGEPSRQEAADLLDLLGRGQDDAVGLTWLLEVQQCDHDGPDPCLAHGDECTAEQPLEASDE